MSDSYLPGEWHPILACVGNGPYLVFDPHLVPKRHPPRNYWATDARVVAKRNDVGDWFACVGGYPLKPTHWMPISQSPLDTQSLEPNT